MESAAYFGLRAAGGGLQNGSYGGSGLGLLWRQVLEDRVARWPPAGLRNRTPTVQSLAGSEELHEGHEA